MKPFNEFKKEVKGDVSPEVENPKETPSVTLSDVVVASTGEVQPKEIEVTSSKNDDRLDAFAALVVEVIDRLLGTTGMLRYRKDFKEKVQKVLKRG